jgi:nucleoside-diphosphate-sugar epimerase
MSVKRILLTGGAGFLGQAILRELERSPIESVRLFDLEPVEVAGRPGIEAVEADVCDYQAVLAACSGVDLVVHTASLVDWGHATPERLTAVNVGGTENVVRACREAGVPGLVYTSSMDVVCGIEPVVAADETLPYPEVFANEYSRTKALAEQVVLGAHGDGLATCVLRPCGMYGEADPYHVENFLGVLESGGLPFRVGDGSAAFQHVYVGNVAHAHVLAIQQLLEPDSPLGGQAYFVTDDSPASNFFDFMDPIVSGLGHRPPPKSRYVPFRLMLGVGALLEGVAALMRPVHHFTPTLTRSSVRFVCHDHTFVGDKFRRDAGYGPVYTEAEAIERTISWFLASGRGA